MHASVSKRLTGLGIALLVLLIALIAAHTAIIRFVAEQALGRATGSRVTFGNVALHSGAVTITGARVSVRGEPLAYIPRIDVQYNLHELLPGSSHRYGLHAVTVYDPRVTVVHNPDGSYNVPNMPKGGPSNNRAAPLNMRLRIINGSMTVTDNTRIDPSARLLVIRPINFNADVHTNGRTRYVAGMSYVVSGAGFPIRGAGVIDAPSGFTLHHWTARRVPLPQLINYELNNANLRMRAGELDNLDARYYGNISASAYMRGGRITMQGISAPIRDVAGPIDITSAGLTTPRIVATIAGAPIYMSGGIYDLKAPKFRLTLQAANDLSRVKQLAAAAARLPLGGNVRLAMLVEGPVRTPLALIHLGSAQMNYGAMPLRDADARLIFDGTTANVLRASLRYGPFRLAARGRIALKNQPSAIEALASVRGPSTAIPYAASILPPMDVRGMLLATGSTMHAFDTQGTIEGTGAAGNVAGDFSLTSAGVGTVDLAMAPHTLQSRIAIDHVHNRVAAVVHASNLVIHPAVVSALPGLQSTSLPAVSGVVSGNLFASKQGALLGLAGNVDVRNAAFSKMSISRANARFAGPPGDIVVSALNAQGPFGTLDASGNISGTNHVALQGRLRGSLSGMAAVAGNLPARGYVDAPITVVYADGRSLAQVHDARLSGASVRGVPIDSFSATVASRGKNVRVYAAKATIAHTASALASGTVGTANTHVALSLSHLDLSQLRGMPLAVHSGYAEAAVQASGTPQSPDLSGALLLDRARYGAYPISASTAFAYSGSTVALDGGLVGLGPALITMDGRVSGVRVGAPPALQYDLTAAIHAADAHALIALAQPKLQKQHIEGSVDAAVHVGGAGRLPAISGTFAVPEGSVNGLAFRDLAGTLRGNPQDIVVRQGRVSVGSTAIAFSATAAKNAMRAQISAPRANLADFNDYFNTGDTLAGTGSLSLGIANAGSSMSTAGDVDLADVRFRRFDIGNTDANWSTRGRTVTMIADVGGTSGRAHLRGSAVLPASGGPGAILTQSDVNLTGTLRSLNLSTWLPMLGMTAPVTGTLDADANAQGRYPDISLAANANVVNGTVGRVELQQAQIALSARRGRGQIQQAIVRIPYLTAMGSGTFGFHSRDPLQLAVRATSPDLGHLMSTVSGKPFNGTGTLDTTMRIAGTRADPQIRDDFTLAALRYGTFTVPRVWGTLSGNSRTIALEHGEVDLKRGRVLAVSGNAPVHFTKNAPVVLDVALQNVDFSDFQSALPHGYTLAGTMAGTMHVRGTVDAPLLTGAIALHNGYFVGPIDQNPIQRINGTVAFAGNRITIPGLQAQVGGGTMDMNATAIIPNFRSLRTATFTSRIIAREAQINSPKYFRGKVSADITALRRPGGIPTISGNLDIPSARIPLTAFWNPHASNTPAKAPFPLAFNLAVNAGNDVRVQSTGVDVGAQGRVAVGGTLASPTLNGAFTSTGGTITFLRRFTIQQATVTFSPANGIMPAVDAQATTQVSSPLTYIALHVTGLAPNNLNISFDSEPPYSREQILALLSGVGNLNGTGGATLASGGGSNFISSLASSQLNSMFTQQLLEPLSAALGNALGLQNLQLTDDFTSGFGVSAAKAFGKHITAVYSANLGSPQRRSLTIEAHHGDSTSFSLVLYSVDSPSLLGANTQTNLFGFNDLANTTVLTPQVGSNGYMLMYEHKFQ
ncbi:MAG TPA: translocation/assembly module TamB domain-containing protein [Candidatus Baltobacteraceae bacterium]|jgi:autotransporter translocation and assembly factor TamB|nr:translocation/assembly module TamB domain-containing protein [Candidatus Baltobacteraceae bacterium]